VIGFWMKVPVHPLTSAQERQGSILTNYVPFPFGVLVIRALFQSVLRRP